MTDGDGHSPAVAFSGLRRLMEPRSWAPCGH